MSANPALHRTVATALVNTSGSPANYGDVGIIDTRFDESWRFETSGSAPGRMAVGVLLNPGGIAVNGRGLYAMGGFAPRVNLTNTASRGDYVRLSSTPGKATAFSSAAAGDFGQVLTAGSAPEVQMFGFTMRA